MSRMLRHAHDLSHTVSGTVNMGLCYPGTIFECFPGDSFKIQAQDLTRFMPQISPTMADVNVGVDFYQVPWRQLFDKIGLDWDAFLTGGENGSDTSVLPTITIPATGYDEGSLADWLNYPCNYVDPQTGNKVVVGAGLELNALPVIAYMHIINENYRDQNFIAKLDLTKYQDFLDGTYVFTDPDGNTISYPMLVNGVFRKAWSRDYYGRAMSNTQRGNVVSVPLSGTPAPVVYGSAVTTGAGGQTVANMVGKQAAGYLASSTNVMATATGGSVNVAPLEADLSGIPAFDLITLRLAARMQRFGEILQKSGARAVEFTYAMFGVRIPDDRIQRPVFHGSFKLPVIFSEVLQTGETTSASPQGNLAGHGITGGTNNPLHIKCIEHGYVVAIMHVMPKPQYQNIVPKYLLRSTRWDIPNPLFQHVGDQPIKRVEIYPNSANPNQNFGYVPHYTELSFVPSTIHGMMKGEMLHWTMARVFSSEPVLSAAFRYAEPSMRSFAVQSMIIGTSQTVVTAPQMQVQVGFIIKGRRLFANASPTLPILALAPDGVVAPPFADNKGFNPAARKSATSR